MKKFMMAAVALICMTMMSVSLTACGGDDDSPSKQKEQIEYFVEGSLGYRVPDKTQADPVPESWKSNFLNPGPKVDYEEAVGKVAPSPNYEDRDGAVKNACEEVYNKHKALKGIVVYGTVTVTKKSGSNVTEVWTKKYE